MMAHILLIDDEEMVRKTIRLALEGAGYHVVEAQSGVDGLKSIQRLRFDLVITDVFMPGKDGIETLLEIKGARPATKVLAISGGGNSHGYEFLRAAKKLGANAVLSKPFQIGELTMMVGELCNLP